MQRRSFMQVLAGAASAAPLGAAAQSERTFVGLQMDAVGFVERGIDVVLDDLRERALVNAVLLDSFWLSRDAAGKQPVGRVPRGFGDPSKGIHMGRLSPKFYQETGFDPREMPVDNPDGMDLLAALEPAFKDRGVRRVALIKDIMPEDMPGFDTIREQDFNGQPATTTCKNNPFYRNFLRGIVADVIESYRVDGIMYMAERQGPLTDTLGARFRGKRRGLAGSRTCFCEHCRATARSRGIDIDRALEGFEQLARFVADGRARNRPLDGFYVSFWRLILRYPELLMWEHMWHENVRETLRLLFDRVQEIDSNVLFGSHVWHNHIMQPIYRAEQDLAELAPYHDFLKVVMYRSCGGPRIASYIESIGETMYGDIPPDELLQFHYRVLNYEEAPYDRVRNEGLKRDFVYRESKRAVAKCEGKRAKVLAGLDVDIPILSHDLGLSDRENAARNTRGDVKDAVLQAFAGGAHGVIISREYTEMKSENLSGVGDAVRELGRNA